MLRFEPGLAKLDRASGLRFPAERRIAKKILVIDDDEEIVGFATLALQTAGYEVFSALDGEEGLYVARSAKPDLILLDLSMPHMHGFEVCEAVRADNGLAGVKIIIASGKNYSVDMRRAKELGADQYIVKPYGYQQLLDAVAARVGGPA